MSLLGMDTIIVAGWIIDLIDRVLLHKTHALPPIRLHSCIHESQALRTKEKCTLAPMVWHRVGVQGGESSSKGTAKVCIIIPSPPLILPIYGASTVHNTEDQEKFVLLCNLSQKPLDIPAGATIAHQEIAHDLEEQSFSMTSLMTSALFSPTHPTLSKRDNQHQQVDKLKSSNDQFVEKHFDLKSAKQLWDSKFVKSLKRLLLTMATTWANQDIIGRISKGEHRINTQEAQPIALPLRRIAWIEKDKIKQEIDKMKEQGIVEDSESLWCSFLVLV